MRIGSGTAGVAITALSCSKNSFLGFGLLPGGLVDVGYCNFVGAHANDWESRGADDNGGVAVSRSV